MRDDVMPTFGPESMRAARRHGAKAARRDGSLDDNPYPSGSCASTAWSTGFRMGLSQRVIYQVNLLVDDVVIDARAHDQLQACHPRGLRISGRHSPSRGLCAGQWTVRLLAAHQFPGRDRRDRKPLPQGWRGSPYESPVGALAQVRRHAQGHSSRLHHPLVTSLGNFSHLLAKGPMMNRLTDKVRDTFNRDGVQVNMTKQRIEVYWMRDPRGVVWLPFSGGPIYHQSRNGRSQMARKAPGGVSLPLAQANPRLADCAW